MHGHLFCVHEFSRLTIFPALAVAAWDSGVIGSSLQVGSGVGGLEGGH